MVSMNHWTISESIAILALVTKKHIEVRTYNYEFYREGAYCLTGNP